jgi:mannosyl-oligosaccharide alpha-1,2-mannosidase
MLALGSRLFSLPDHLDIARKLVDGCIWAYNAPSTGYHARNVPYGPLRIYRFLCLGRVQKWHSGILDRLSSEDTRSVSQVIAEKPLPEGFTDIGDARYILRPEAIESIFTLYRITGDKRLQDAAWKMFETIDKYTRTEFANAALDDVTVTNGDPPKSDRTESFWTAETLKYLYLIFSEPTLISLDDYVFNTEAHPFRRPVQYRLTKVGEAGSGFSVASWYYLASIHSRILHCRNSKSSMALVPQEGRNAHS